MKNKGVFEQKKQTQGNSFSKLVEIMKLHKMKIPQNEFKINIPNAEAEVRFLLQKFLDIEKKKMQWISPYNEIVKWLSDNKGKGLFLYGNVGLGKTLFCRYVIPALVLNYTEKVMHCFDMDEVNKDNLNAIKQKRIIGLDDVGTENIINDFGNKKDAFAEIMDNAEKRNNIVVISTNLGAEQIRERYGDRVLDRVLKMTIRVPFQGKSLRY